MGNEIKFKPATFYLEVVDRLAKAVEGLKPEDMDTERRGGDRDSKRGSGELLDEVPRVVALVETERTVVVVEGDVTEPPPTTLSSLKESSDKGKARDMGPLPTLNSSEPAATPNSNDKATDTSSPTTSSTSASPTSACESDSPTSSPQHQSRESEPKDLRPIPLHEPSR